ncbi:MAG: crossover junction endodeoxyribonuclease RuvC [Thermoanaerobaculia bacterium]|nr:crossover junction endodeoxyribonuclease RuvC [Thermoanaerobaculia bacterium]
MSRQIRIRRSSGNASKLPKRILGIDPGSVVTGYGVIDSIRGKLQLVEQGCIRTKRGDDFCERLGQIHAGIREVIARTKPQAVAVETPFSGLNAKSLIQLAQARGVILLAVHGAGLAVHEYSPRSVKSAVVGYGGAEKQQIGRMVRLLVNGIDGAKISADAADALAIAICHAHSARLTTGFAGI